MTIAGPGGRRWIIFGVTSAALLLGAIDGTIVATALPTLQHQLGAKVSVSAWTITAYSLGVISALPIAGRLSDVVGRKRMFLGCAGLFTAASFSCGLAGSIYVLIGLRFLQALGGAGLMPSTAGVISDQFGASRDRPIGLMTSIFPLGSMIGPALGGIIVAYASWRLIFFINVPVGIALILLLWRMLPPDATFKRENVRVDLLASVLMLLTVLCLMLSLNMLGQPPQVDRAIVLLGLCVAFGTALIARQRSSPNPILPTQLLTQRAFAFVNGLNVLYGAAALGVFSLLPLYAQERFGLGPVLAGTLLTIRAACMSLMSTITSMLLLQRFGYRRPMSVGFGILALGLLLIAVEPSSIPPFAWLSASCVLSGLAIGTSGPPSNNASLQLMPTHVAAISGLRATFRQLGGILAISISAAIISTSSRGIEVYPLVTAVLATLTLLAIPAILEVPESPQLIPSR